MCLGTLPVHYGQHLNKVLYPRLDQVTKLLAQDTAYPASIPVIEERDMIVVESPRMIAYDYAIMLHDDLIAQYGGSYGIAKEGQLRYALEIPRMTVFGQEAYPSLALKVAHMVESIVCGHVFVDGNKRTGWHIASMFCASNGYLLEPEYPEDGRDAVLCLCTKAWSVDQFAQWVNSNLIRR